jgi:hypothetical protein
VAREGVGAGGRNDPSLYAHMNNKTIKKKIDTKVYGLYGEIKLTF